MSQPTPILTDAASLRERVHAKALRAVETTFPLDMRERKLEVKDLRVVAKHYSPEEQRRALLTGTSLDEAVKGTLVLKSSDGKVLDEAKNFTVVHLPYLTERHTIIADGNEYQVANQLRRKPGVYTARADNGELKAIFNLGRGKNFDLGFEPQKGTFHLAYGTTNVPLYPVLKALGVDHDKVVEHWGRGVADANAAAHGRDTEKAVAKLYSKLVHPSVLNIKAPHEAKLEDVRRKLDQTTLDPHVTAATLGKGYDKVTPDALLAAARKVLAVHAGKTPTDDTDALTFKTFHALDDFLAERIKLSARAWAPKAKFALSGKTSVREALRPAPFSDAVRKFVTTSSLTAVPTGINPLELIDHAVKVTSLGEGGIPSDRAIPLDARMIHNTHFGALDPIRTPESSHSGVDIRATIAAHRDDAGNLYTVARNVKTGKDEFLKAGDLGNHVVAFAGENLKGEVDAFVKGRVTQVDGSKVTHQLGHTSHAYSPATTLIPMIHSIQGNRAIMGSKMGTQALPLIEREAPFVQVRSHLPGGESFEAVYGHMVVPRAPVSGTIHKIEDGWIYIKPHGAKKQATWYIDPEDLLTKEAKDEDLVKVPFQRLFPFPSKTYLHHDLTVRVGDKVQEGQRLGESNFTRDGVLALGKNLRVAYVPHYGVNSNDAVVISEGASRKLTSEHMYREVYPLGAQIELNRERHRMYYGTKYGAKAYDVLDEQGVIKKGATVHPKDILIAGLTKTQVSGTDALLGRISKSLARPYQEVVLTWNHGTPGEVVDVVRTSSQVTVLVRTREAMQIGDKLAGRYGNKGVVAKIIPDHEMLQDERGNPIDLLLTSAGVVSRINHAQVIETAVGKVVEKTGKPIVYDNNERRNAVEWASDLLKQHGIKDKETLYDPVLKRPIRGHDGKGVLVGRQFIYKLFKSTDTNFAGHGVGPYDLNEQPLKTGGDDSAKGIGKMEFDALIAHNARNFLREAATVKGQKNDEFWKAVQLGAPLPIAKPPFAFSKFVGMLEGAGLRVDRRGSKFKLLPMTDAHVTAKSTGALQNAKTLVAKNLKPEAGGLFDPRLTGGPQGTLYSHIDLPEPIPHPVFKEPVRRLLGLSEKEFDSRLGEHGGVWFRDQLKRIDVPGKLSELRNRMVKATGAELNDIVKQIKYLEALQKERLLPHEAYVVSKVPVVPPVFRPILPQPHDPSMLMVADANKLYGHLMDSNHTLKTTALESDRAKHRKQVFNAVAALYGTEDVENDELRGQAVKGFLSNIAGVGTPKGGFFQRKLMRRTQDVSGRGTAVPDANLGMDHVGLPEQMLWQMYDKLVVARLVRTGYPALDARERVNKKDPVAREALLAETRERPVLINRAPTLHRWSIVAAHPVPVQGKTIRVNPFIEKGMNLDYDGDTLQVHVPVSQDAIEEAKHMTLSNMLLSDQTRRKLMAFPQHEAIIGFTHASKVGDPKGPVRKFKTTDDAVAAWRKGELDLNAHVEIEHPAKVASDVAPEEGTLLTFDTAGREDMAHLLESTLCWLASGDA